MCFVLEEKKPRLFNSVNLNLNLNGTSVNFLGFVKLIKLAELFKAFCRNSTYIHKVLRLGSSKKFPRREIILISLLKKLVLKTHAVNRRQEGGVTAVVGPIGIYHFNFCDSGVSLFASEVTLAELYVVKVHCKTHIRNEFFESLLVKLYKAVESFYARRNRILDFYGFLFLKARLACFNGVYNVLFDFFKLSSRNFSVKHINLRTCYARLVTLGYELNTLSRRVCTLVKLTGKILGCKHLCTVVFNLLVNVVELRL